MSTPVRTLTRTIAEGSTWLTGSTVLAKCVGVATTLLTLAALSVFEYGTAKLILSALGFLAIFALPGLTEIVVADMGIERGRGRLASARTLLNQYFVYNLILGAAGFLGMFFGAHLLAAHLGNNYLYATGLLKVLSFQFLIGPFRSSAYVLWRVQCAFATQSLHRVVESCVRFGLTLLFLVTLEWNVRGYIVAYTFTEAIALAPFLWSIIRSYRALGGTLETDRLSLWSSLKEHGKWVVAQGYLHSVVQSARLWIIKAMFGTGGTEAVGLFSAAYGIYQHLVSLVPLKYILASVMPQYDPASETFRKLVVKGVKYNIASGVLIGITGALGVPVLMWLLLPAYTSAIPLFEWMLPNILAGAASGVFTVVFFALRQQRDMFWVNVVLSALTCVLLPLCLAVFGIYGTAVELTLTAAIFTLERYRRIRRVLPHMALPWRAFFTFDEFDRKILRRIFARMPLVRGVVG